MHSYIVKYAVSDNAEDLPSIAMNTVVHSHWSVLGDNNVASDIIDSGKGYADTNYTRN